MYTTYHDAHRCFEETLSASKLDTLVERCENFRTFPQEEPELLGYEFTEVGLPRQIFGLFHAPLAYLRTFWCAVSVYP